MGFYGLLKQRMKNGWRQVAVLLFFSVLFSAAVLGCIVVYSAAGSAKENVGKYVEGDVRVYSCEDKSYEKYTLEGERIPYDWVQKIAQDDRIKGCRVMSMAGVDGVDVKSISQFLFSSIENVDAEQAGVFDFSGGALSLVYETDMMENYRFSEYGETIVEGRPLERGETGNKAVIARPIANRAGLSVGDTFEVETMSGERIPLEIIGLSSFGERGFGLTTPARSMYYEYIYTTKEVVDRANGTGNVFEAVFEFSDCAQAESFLASIQDEIGREGYLTSENLSGFYSSRQVFGNIQATMNVLLVAVTILGAFLIGLFAVYSVSGRVKEIGILTAMGMNREIIVLQYVLEKLVPVLAGNVLCLGIFFACKGWIEAVLTGWFGNMGEVAISLGMGQLTLYLGISLFMVLFAALYVGYKVAFCKPKELIVEPS